MTKECSNTNPYSLSYLSFLLRDSSQLFHSKSKFLAILFGLQCLTADLVRENRMILSNYFAKKWNHPAATMAVIVIGIATSLRAEPGEGLTKGPFDGKRPNDAVQLVGKRGHILIAEVPKVKNQWVFKDGI